MLKNKRGVSVIIGYVLLIAIVISISVVVYTWMKSYVPKGALQCPDGVSISISDYNYNCSVTNNVLNFTVVNDGTFSIGGYAIKVSNSSDQQIATIDITPFYEGRESAPAGGGTVFFGPCSTKICNTMDPGKIVLDNTFNLSNDPQAIGTLHSIEITPIRYIEYNGQIRLATCSNAAVDEVLTCKK